MYFRRVLYGQRVGAYIYIYIYLFIYTYTHTHIHTHTRIYIYINNIADDCVGPVTKDIEVKTAELQRPPGIETAGVGEGHPDQNIDGQAPEPAIDGAPLAASDQEAPALVRRSSA